MSMFGLVALSGVVVNDSLIMVDFINRNRRLYSNITDAVLQAGVNRFRAILLTSLTTFFGLVPLMTELAPSGVETSPTTGTEPSSVETTSETA